MTQVPAEPSDVRRRAVAVEQEFLAAAEANLRGARGLLINGTWFEQERDNFSGEEAVHRAMVERGLFGHEVKHSVPQSERLIMRGYQRRLLIFGRRLSSLTVASVVAPPGPLFEGKWPAPMSLGDVTAHVRELLRAATGRVPHLVAVCSPGGFAPEVWGTTLPFPNVHVVLVEPRGEGGWKVGAVTRGTDESLVRLFDPEAVSEKFRRIRRELEANSSDLLVGGLSAVNLSRKLDVPMRLVEQMFESVSRAEPELRVSRQAGDVLLFRGAPLNDMKEDGSMSVAEWIRSLFMRKGDEARKVNVLIERRNALARRRDRIYEDIAALEQREHKMLEEGKRNKSAVARRRLAAQVSQLRKEIARWNTSAAMLNRQINVISTDVHNLTLLQQGRMAQLPSAEELTEHAVAAEEMLETLASETQLVEELEVGISESLMSDDEAAILREFEEADQKVTEAPAAKKAAQATPAPAAETVRASRETAADDEPFGEPASEESRREGPQAE